MNEVKMSFEAINPFVRYCHVFEIQRGMPFVKVTALDYRLMYIIDGYGFMEVNGIRYEAAKGCLFFWQPGIMYSILPEPQHPFTIIGFNFDFTCDHSDISYPVPPEDEASFGREKIVELVNFIDLEPFNRPIILKNMQSQENSLLEMTNEYNTRKRYYTGKIRGNFSALMFDIARNLSAAGSADEASGSKVDLVIRYIQEHYSSPITNHEIGQHFNFHPIYINRLMVKHTGTALHQYIINYRISVALNLLQTTNKSVTEIAYSVGFRDINYFSRYFKKLVGLSPKKYIYASKKASLG